MRKMMYGLQPCLRARPAAVGSLDDDYYCITRLAGPNAVPACMRKKTCASVDNSPRNERFRRIGTERPGRLQRRPSVPIGFSLRVVPAGPLLAGKSDWVWAWTNGQAGHVTGRCLWPGRVLSVSAEWCE